MKHHYSIVGPGLKYSIFRSTAEAIHEVFDFMISEWAESGIDPDELQILEPEVSEIPKDHYLRGDQTMIPVGYQLPQALDFDVPDWLIQNDERLERYYSALDKCGDMMAQWAYRPNVAFVSAFTAYVRELDFYLCAIAQSKSENDSAIDLALNAMKTAEANYLKGDQQVEVTVQLFQREPGDHWSGKIISGIKEWGANDYDQGKVLDTDSYQSVIRAIRRWCSAQRFMIKNHQYALLDGTADNAEKAMVFDQRMSEVIADFDI